MIKIESNDFTIETEDVETAIRFLNTLIQDPIGQIKRAPKKMVSWTENEIKYLIKQMPSRSSGDMAMDPFLRKRHTSAAIQKRYSDLRIGTKERLGRGVFRVVQKIKKEQKQNIKVKVPINVARVSQQGNVDRLLGDFAETTQ